VLGSGNMADASTSESAVELGEGSGRHFDLSRNHIVDVRSIPALPTTTACRRASLHRRAARKP
jgi:hypothetical protein